MSGEKFLQRKSWRKNFSAKKFLKEYLGKSQLKLKIKKINPGRKKLVK